MKTFEYTIKDPTGIHVRPAGLLAKESKRFQSKITLECHGKTTDLRKLMAVMAMAIKQGNCVTITADGSDETEAISAIQALFERNL